MVPNLCPLHSTLNPERIWYSVLDLKDTFFCVPLALKSQHIFALEWQDPGNRRKQLCWTVLPQGLKIPPPFSERFYLRILMTLS